MRVIQFSRRGVLAAPALLTAGAQSVRHAHQMRLALPLEGYDDTEFLPFAPDATPPVPWVEVLPAFLAAYPPEHPDHLPGGASRHSVGCVYFGFRHAGFS